MGIVFTEREETLISIIEELNKRLEKVQLGVNHIRGRSPAYALATLTADCEQATPIPDVLEYVVSRVYKVRVEDVPDFIIKKVASGESSLVSLHKLRHMQSERSL